MIARLAEHLGEERIVAPLARIADGMERQHVLEHVTRQVPRSHHIGKGHQRPLLCHRHLTGCRRHVVAIELGVVLVVTLTDHQHDVRHTEGATVYHNLVLHRQERFQLFRGETVGIDTEHQAIDGQVEFRLRFLRQLVLHLADGLLGHQSVDSLLVHLALVPGVHQQQGDADAQNTPAARPHEVHHHGIQFRQDDAPLHTAYHLAGNRPEDMRQQDEQYIAYRRREDIPTEIA